MPIFAMKRPRQALLAHPNNYAYDNAQPQPTGIAAFRQFGLSVIYLIIYLFVCYLFIIRYLLINFYLLIIEDIHKYTWRERKEKKRKKIA